MAQIEITGFGDSAILSGGAFPDAYMLQGHTASSSGTGLIDPFVRFQKSGTEIGYNTDFRPVEYDENTDGNFTDSLPLSDVPISNGLDLDGNGTIDVQGLFYEFRLDLNQGNGGSDSFITVDAIQLYLANAGNLTNFNDPTEAGADGFGANSVLIWDLDGGTKDPSNYLVLNDVDSGSGSSDYFFYVPVSAFAGKDPSFTYVYLYSEFGVTGSVTLANGADVNHDGDYKDAFEIAPGTKITTTANGGFEEWNISPDYSLEWEKRNEDGTQLVGGATFTVDVDPQDNKLANYTITVVDNGINDLDPDAGQIKISGDLVQGSYVITETKAPAGWGLDDDVTRNVTIGSKDLHVVVGTQGKDDPGNTDASDFHNRLASLEWEKRNEDGTALLGGATFEVKAAGGGTITVTDNDVNDLDKDDGQFKLGNLKLDTYTVTETKAPTGWALDDSVSRTETLTDANFNAVIGAQGSDQSGNGPADADFHNRLGTLEWEKRNEDGSQLLDGATFTITGPGGYSLTVTDNDINDLDKDAGQFKLANLKLGTYSITETKAPAGWGLDDSITRTETITTGNLNAVVGTQGKDDAGNGPGEADFHNRLGSLEWEKRNEVGDQLVGGATFTINGPNNFVITVTDNGIGDLDLDLGQIKIGGLSLGTYTVTETTAPAGYGFDPDPTRVETISDSNLYAVIGAQDKNDTGVGEDIDFHDPLLGGTRTPGFWANPNNGGLFWDGDPNNNPKAGTEGFPDGDLLVIGKTTGGPGSADDYILIGDWDGSGTETGAEETIKVLRSEALEFLNASAKDQQDGRFMLMRDLVATWLNKLQGSNTGVVHAYIDEAIDWMTKTTPGLSDGVLSTEELLSANAVATKSDPWQLGFDGPDVGTTISADVASEDILAGGLLHSYLDTYNNTGSII